MKTARHFLGLALALASWVSLADAEPYAYVANQQDSSVSVIDIPTNTVLTTISPLGFLPGWVAANGARGVVYVSNYGGVGAPVYYLSVIDTTNNTVSGAIQVGTEPGEIAVEPAGRFVYVATIDGVQTIDTTTNTVVSTIPLRGREGLAVNPAGTRLYKTIPTGNGGGGPGLVGVVDTSTNAILTQIQLAYSPAGIAVNPAGTRVFVADEGEVSVIDTATNLLLGTISLGPIGNSPGNLVFDPAGAFAYVTVPGAVKVIDVAAGSTVATIPVGLGGPNDVKVSPDGAYAYATNYVDNTVSVIDTSSRTVIKTLDVGPAPAGIGIYTPVHLCPAGNVLANPDAIYDVDANAGLVTDGTTGLVWKRCSEGQSGAGCTGTASSMTWAQALTSAASSSFAGKSDWRLPNLKELESLFEPACFAPTINKNAFPSTASDAYWTSTTYTYYPAQAWFLNFSGVVNVDNPGYKTQTHAVRLVRGGRPMDTFDDKSDSTPNGFSFTAQTGVPRGAPVTSNTVTLAGFSTVADISIAGGGTALYSINGGTLTASPGTVMSGDTVQVQQTSSSSANTTTTATVTVASVHVNYAVTTGSALLASGLFADGFEDGNTSLWSSHQP